MNPYLIRALAFLEDVYDDEHELFPASTVVVNDRYVSTFDYQQARRYSINCLLGLKRAAAKGIDAPIVDRADDLVERFLDRHLAAISNRGDQGLLLVLLADRFGDGAAEGTLRQLERAAESGEPAALPLQEVCWMLWGAVELVRNGVTQAAPLAAQLFRALHRSFFNRDSLLPHHTKRLWRRNSVSFGGFVYFLRVLYEYADVFSDEYAATLFRFGVLRALDLQRPQGEWPWLIDVKSAKPIDVYPVYGVHQDSMSMLFLLPALDLGLPGVRESIERSYAWVLGANETSTPMFREKPFLRYRALERRGGLQRERRYVRSLPGVVRLSRRHPNRRGGIRVNRECRSYEMGWIVYVWAGRPEQLALTASGPPVRFS